MERKTVSLVSTRRAMEQFRVDLHVFSDATALLSVKNAIHPETTVVVVDLEMLAEQVRIAQAEQQDIIDPVAVEVRREYYSNGKMVKSIYVTEQESV